MKENRELSKGIRKLNKKTSADPMGGGDYCYFLPSRAGKKSNIVELMLINEGDYPLYDISAKIDDVEKLTDMVKKDSETGNLPYASMTSTNTMLAEAT